MTIAIIIIAGIALIVSLVGMVIANLEKMDIGADWTDE